MDRNSTFPSTIPTIPNTTSPPTADPARAHTGTGSRAVWATLASMLILAGCQNTAPTGRTPSQPFTADAAGQTVVVPRLEPTGMSLSGAYLAGRHAMNARDLDNAAAFLGRALDSDPKNFDLMRQTFLVLLSEGRLEEAEPLGRALIASDPDGAETATASLVVAMLDLAKGDLMAAEAQLKALPARGLNGIIGPMARAWILAGQGDTVGALAALEPLRANAGVSNLLTLHEALIQDAAGNRTEAEELFRATLDGQNRISFRLAEMAGQFFERTGRPDEARTVYERFVDANPDSQVLAPAFARLDSGGDIPAKIDGPQMGVAEALFDLASVLQQERASDMALIYSRLSLALDPTLAVSSVLIGEILETQGRYDAAVDAYAQIDEDSPFSWSTRLRAAESLNDLERTDEAIAILRDMAAERPERYDALSQLGDIFRRRERFSEAVDAYREAIDRVPDVTQRHWSLFYTNGIALHRSDQWDEAEAAFKRALELQPDQPYVLNYLGYSWIEQGRNIPEAKTMIEKAVEQRPDDGYIVDSLGWVHYVTGDYPAAVIQLERAVELRPQDPTINDHLGDAYWKVGRFNEARFQWRRALSLNPEDDQIATIEQKIERGLVDGVAQTRDR